MDGAAKCRVDWKGTKKEGKRVGFVLVFNDHLDCDSWAPKTVPCGARKCTSELVVC